jgi:hypothetical protein
MIETFFSTGLLSSFTENWVKTTPFEYLRIHSGFSNRRMSVYRGTSWRKITETHSANLGHFPRKRFMTIGTFLSQWRTSFSPCFLFSSSERCVQLYSLQIRYWQNYSDSEKTKRMITRSQLDWMLTLFVHTTKKARSQDMPITSLFPD